MKISQGVRIVRQIGFIFVVIVTLLSVIMDKGTSHALRVAHKVKYKRLRALNSEVEVIKNLHELWNLNQMIKLL